MEYQPFLIPETQHVFDTRLKRFVQEHFPEHEIKSQKEGAAIRYEINFKGGLIAEIDSLPKSDQLEIRTAAPSSIESELCRTFFAMIERDYRIQMDWVSILFTHPSFEMLTNKNKGETDNEVFRDELADIVSEKLPALVTDESMEIDENEKLVGGKKPNWFPSREETILRWKITYQLWLELQKEFTQLKLNGWEEDPKPNIDDFNDRLLNTNPKLGGFGNRTYKNIIKAGDKGWLN